MAHKRTQLQLLENVRLDGRVIENPLSLTSPSTTVTVEEASSPILMFEVRANSLTVSVTDTGGAGGGFSATLSGVLPLTELHLVDGILLFDVLSVGAGIAATAGVQAAMGTTAATDGVLNGTEADLSAANSGTLVAGAVSLRSRTSAIGAQVDATSPTSWYINFGVADADISSNSSIVCDIVARLFFIDVSRGL